MNLTFLMNRFDHSYQMTPMYPKTHGFLKNPMFQNYRFDLRFLMTLMYPRNRFDQRYLRNPMFQKSRMYQNFHFVPKCLMNHPFHLNLRCRHFH